MDKQAILQAVERQGYFLLAKAHLNSPGYSGLLVAIREEPTGLGYDSQSVRLLIADKSSDPGWETMSYKTTLPRAKQVVPGRVILRDRSKEKIEKKWLINTNHWPTRPTTLEELLAPDDSHML